MKVAKVLRTNRTMRHMPAAIAQRRKSSEDGQSLMEFAFLLPLLCLLAVGVVELGRAAAFTIAVNNAATAGVEYGAQSAVTAVDINGMQNRAIADANFNFGTITATATYGCRCDDAVGLSCPNPIPPQSSCSDSELDCGSGQIVQCVQVNTHGQWESLLHYPGIPNSFQANGQAIMRVQR